MNLVDETVVDEGAADLDQESNEGEKKENKISTAGAPSHLQGADANRLGPPRRASPPGQAFYRSTQASNPVGRDSHLGSASGHTLSQAMHGAATLATTWAGPGEARSPSSGCRRGRVARAVQ
jgi:hypothetical protein